MTGALDRGARIFKLHLQVGGFDPRAAELDAVWALLAETGTPVVVHAGSGPVPSGFTGPDPIGEVLARHPRLAILIAHLGAPEYEDFLDLAARYERGRLDTTMALTDFFEEWRPFPPGGARSCATWAWPARSCSAATSRTSRTRTPTSSRRWPALDLGDDWLRAVCWHERRDPVRPEGLNATGVISRRSWPARATIMATARAKGAHPHEEGSRLDRARRC